MTKLERKILIATICISVIIRVLSAIYLGNKVINLPGTFDQISYDAIARRILEGHGFSFGELWWPITAANTPTAHWSFLYSLFLASVYDIFGIMPLAARIIQAVIAGIFTPLLLFRLGSKVFGPKVGLSAAAISAIYIYLVYYAAALMTETFFIIGILWSFDLALEIRYTNNPRTKQWLLLGVAITITTLLRQTFIPIIALIGIWLWYSAEGNRIRIIKGFTISIVILLLGIVPWTIRNYRVYHHFVLLNTNAGYAFFLANHPAFGTNFPDELPSADYYRSLIPSELYSLDEATIEKELMSLSIRTIKNDPLRYLILTINKIEDQFKFWPSSSSPTISNISRVGSFGLFLPFMCFGTLLVLIRPKRYILVPDITNSRKSIIRFFIKSPIALWLGFFLVLTMMHLASWPAIRYRLPTDTIMILFAALGIVVLYSGFISLRRGKVR